MIRQHLVANGLFETAEKLTEEANLLGDGKTSSGGKEKHVCLAKVEKWEVTAMCNSR